MPRRIAVIMAGGSGERFWPLSTPQRPKQLLKLTSPTETMLEEAVRRVEPVVGEGNVFIATSTALRDPVTDAEIVARENVWAEPAKKNTLGCLTWVSANLLAADERHVTVAVLTADHKISEPEHFQGTVAAALDLAEEDGALVTMGIPPIRPETGYGYIEADLGQTVTTAQGRTGYRSLSFREKPDAATAQAFVDAGNFMWNSGMFFFSLESFLQELAHAQPEARALVDQMAEAIRVGDSGRAAELFGRLPSISIDFAVMEKAQRILVVPADFPWDDVGAWDALERTLEPQETGNVVQGDAMLIDSKGCIVVNDTEQMSVGVLGLENVVVVVTGHAVLVCTKENAQRVKELTAGIAAMKQTSA